MWPVGHAVETLITFELENDVGLLLLGILAQHDLALRRIACTGHSPPAPHRLRQRRRRRACARGEAAWDQRVTATLTSDHNTGSTPGAHAARAPLALPRGHGGDAEGACAPWTLPWARVRGRQTQRRAAVPPLPGVLDGTSETAGGRHNPSVQCTLYRAQNPRLAIFARAENYGGGEDQPPPPQPCNPLFLPLRYGLTLCPDGGRRPRGIRVSGARGGAHVRRRG